MLQMHQVGTPSELIKHSRPTENPFHKLSFSEWRVDRGAGQGWNQISSRHGNRGEVNFCTKKILS